MPVVVLKLGGSVITKKKENRLEVDDLNLKRLAEEISKAKKKAGFRLVVVHGAGPFGHIPAKEFGLAEGLGSEKQLLGFSLTHKSMEELNFSVVEALIGAGLNAIAFQPSSLGVLRDGELVYLPTEALSKLLDMDMVPVAYGDVLVDEKKGLGILSGDHLVPYLARKLGAKRVIITTDVEGVYDQEPGEGGAKLIKEITSKNIGSLRVGGSKATDVTGGMRRKLEELLDLAESGIESEIISAAKPGLLEKALGGDRSLGTLIRE